LRSNGCTTVTKPRPTTPNVKRVLNEYTAL
jgi:hypothetical protein